MESNVAATSGKEKSSSNDYIKHIIFNAKNFGKVVSIKDGVAFVVNLKNVTFGELVLFIPSPLRLKKHREKNQQS
jgi:F0F1-type ATP synthase alpha subunit